MHITTSSISYVDRCRTSSSSFAGTRSSVAPSTKHFGFNFARHFARSRRVSPSSSAVIVKASDGDILPASRDDDEDFDEDDFYSDSAPALLNSGALRPRSPSDSALVAADPMQLLPESGQCVGCGIDLQCEDEAAPGYFKIPKRLLERTSKIPPGVIAIEPDSPLLQDPSARREAEARGLIKGQGKGKGDGATPSGRPSSPGLQAEVQEEYERRVGEWLDDPEAADFAGRPQGPLSKKPLSVREARRELLESKSQIYCARCFSLKHEGRVKAPEIERQLPGFDLLKAVGPYLAHPTPGKSTVVVAVVDAVDFDGSLPRNAIKALWPKDREGRLIRPRGTHFVLVANKVDLLPSYVSQKRLQEWVKRRTRQAGLPDPTDIHLVSAQEGKGVQALLETLEKLGQPKGNVFVVGAQNAGKSTLLNAMRRARDLPANLTIAALPGTTLGLIKVNGVFPHYIRLFDTPGVPHPYQLSARLTPEEVRMLLPRKPLRPRTFAMKMRQTLHIGGLARVDVKRTPGTGPIYVTLWASMDVACFWGSTESADAFYEAHVGRELTPPVGDLQRIRRMGELIPSVVTVEGESWKESSVDVAIAGLGWFGVTVDGRCELEVRTHDGIAVTTHMPLIPDLAKDWERPGYDGAAKMLASAKRAEEEKRRKAEDREKKREARKAGEKGLQGRAARFGPGMVAEDEERPLESDLDSAESPDPRARP